MRRAGKAADKSDRGESALGHYGLGVEAPWYEGWKLTDEERQVFRERSRRSREAKIQSLTRQAKRAHRVPKARLKPEELMPQLPRNGLRTLSLFSGGGGLDLGFDVAGFEHAVSYEIVHDAAETLCRNRPSWDVRMGEAGDVTQASWRELKGSIDVVHGGPPCQPFSVAGRQRGSSDERDLVPEFARAVRELRPRAFVAENVAALAGPKFAEYLSTTLLNPLRREYRITMGLLTAPAFGVPQSRTRLFIVGIRRDRDRECVLPVPTHSYGHLTNQVQHRLVFDGPRLPNCMGVREALGLPSIGYDALAPTLRSGLTGPRHTTSVLSSVAALNAWSRLRIWPNGVAADRERASRFPAPEGQFRLAVQDCALLQGFPESWPFNGAVYMALGQIGNSVAPPVAYAVARAIRAALA